MSQATASFEKSSDKIIALVGAPNSGKTTLYNWLTGSKFRTVNYPGATVEYSLGALSESYGGGLQLMDTPGTYSLHPKSADEEVTLKALYENSTLGKPQAVIVVVDGTQLSRHLLLAEQMHETGYPMILVVTMVDLLRKQDLELNLKILSNHLKCVVIPFDGVTGLGVSQLVEALRKNEIHAVPSQPQSWTQEFTEERIKVCETIAQRALFKAPNDRLKLEKVFSGTEKVDRILLHPVGGLLMFFLIMATLFSGIYWLATPIMDLLDSAFSEIGQGVLALAPEALWADFVSHGLIASFSAVLVFVPQIFILFLGIGILESSGYLARAATLIDRPFSQLGLSGRSFVPLLSGFACAVPALMATRNIPSRRDRWITNFMIPLMSCSARLPVYALLLGFLFPNESAWKAGIALAGLYFGAIFLGGLTAGILHRLIPKDQGSFFMMELPLYRRPRWSIVLHQSLQRTQSFVFKAGPIIFSLAIILWFGTTFPKNQSAVANMAGVSAQPAKSDIESSYAGQLGRFLEPVFEPMGVDWRVGVGLISAFAAREVFVSSMAVVFQAASGDADSQQKTLLEIMGNAVNQKGQRIFTLSSVLGLIVFFMIALQCISTVGMAYREANSWAFAIGQLLSFNLIAYVLAVSLVQGLRALGVS